MSDDSGNLQDTRRANAEDAAKRAETLIELLRYVSGLDERAPNSLLEAQASPGHERTTNAYTCVVPEYIRESSFPELISAEKLDAIIGKLLSSTTLSAPIYQRTDIASITIALQAAKIDELTPSHYKLLIELNPKVASDVLSYLLRSDPDRINTIIGVLMSMEFSVQCADVIRKIYKTAPSLPTAPLVTYIQHLFPNLLRFVETLDADPPRPRYGDACGNVIERGDDKIRRLVHGDQRVLSTVFVQPGHVHPSSNS
ncbi:unnamed protein product, partial [Mesorhabditis spiculigera]